MEVKEGYKQTEVGVIPEDWKIKSVKELAHITTGSKNTQDRINNGTYPFFVRSQTIERINSYSFHGEAVLTAGDGVGTGKVFHYINGKFDTHQRVYRITDFNNDTDGYFFFLYFSNHFYGRIMQMTAKSSVDSVRMEMIADMQIPLPPSKSEQEAIAEALSDADALTTSLEQLIAKKCQIKQGAMQELLTGKKRLPGFNEEWNVGVFESLCKTFTKQTGFDYSANIKPTLIKAVTENHIPFIQNKDFGGKEVNYNTDYFIPEVVAIRFPNILLDEECLLISISGSIGKVGIFSNQQKAFIGGAVAVAKFKRKEQLQWVLYYLQSFEGQNKMFNNVKAGSHQNLILDDIRKFTIPLPPKAEQEAIAIILSDMDSELDTLNSKLSKARQVKQGMMHNLLTGKIRLI
jgi:type I restriction enzyme, S subunit